MLKVQLFRLFFKELQKRKQICLSQLRRIRWNVVLSMNFRKCMQILLFLGEFILNIFYFDALLIEYFCRHPTPEKRPVDFKAVTKTVQNFLDITNAGLVPGIDPNKDNIAVWDNAIKEFYKSKSKL